VPNKKPLAGIKDTPSGHEAKPSVLLYKRLIPFSRDYLSSKK
jgi:hypothetical protein